MGRGWVAILVLGGLGRCFVVGVHQTSPLAVAEEGRDEVHHIDEGGDVILCSIEGDEARSVR